MNGTVREWLDKADGDFHTAGREMRVADAANFDAVCFHSQQCIEKMMKALLIHRGVVPPRTHDLVKLDGLLQEQFPNWECASEDLRLLTLMGVTFRYPGEAADREDSVEAFQICSRLRDRLMELIAAA